MSNIEKIIIIPIMAIIVLIALLAQKIPELKLSIAVFMLIASTAVWWRHEKAMNELFKEYRT